MDAKKIVKKHDRNRVLAALSYLAGFPLFVLMVFIGSIPFASGAAFGSTQYYGVYIALAVWLVMTLIQIIVALISRSYSARALILVIFTLVIMIGGSVFFDIWAQKQVDNARIEYVKELKGLADDAEVDLADYPDLEIKNYNYQINHYVTWTNVGSLTDTYNGMVAEFCRVYNIGFNSSVLGDVNTDGSNYGAPVLTDADGNPEYWFGETGDVYKENGLYADGYIFSVPVATEILITYYETQNYYKAQNKNADDELDAALTQAAASSEWNNYKNSKEYKDAYGANGTAESYMITEARLERVIAALGKGLYEKGAYEIISKNMGKLLSLVGIDLNEIGFTQSTLMNLDSDKAFTLVSKVIEALNLDLELNLTKADVMALLEPFSSYQVSNVKPLMYFIKDQRLRTYAYAKYFGETHGGNIGSLLIPNSNGKVGCITMDNSGLTAEENAFTLQELYLLKTYNGYAPKLFPLFAARRYAYIFAGIASLMLVIYYYARLKVYLTAKRLEKLGGGVR